MKCELCKLEHNTIGKPALCTKCAAKMIDKFSYASPFEIQDLVRQFIRNNKTKRA